MKPRHPCAPGAAGRGPLRVLASLLALTLGACAVGPDFERPQAPADAAWPQDATPERMPAHAGAEVEQHLHAGIQPERRWWQAFRSPALDALIDAALRANPDVAAARAALLAAHELWLAQRATLAPSVQAGYSLARQRNAVGTLAPTLGSGEAVFNLHTAQVTVGYVPDVFGGQHRQAEQAAALEEVQRWQAEAAGLTLAANVVLSAINEAGLRAQLEATTSLISVQTGMRDLLARQRDLGAATEADVLAQEAALAQLQGSLPALRRQLAQQQHLRLALGGRSPADHDPGFTLADLTLPAELPLLLPSQLVDRRPDVRAAEAQLHAATAGQAIASSNRLPQFDLTASYGGSSTRPGDLLAPANTFWSLAGSLAVTVFDAGALAHRERAAEAQRVQAAAQYRSTVLTAFQNVADVLVALREDAEAVQAATSAEQAAARSLELARQGLLLGTSGSLPVLQAEQALLTARVAGAQARTSRLADTVALYQSLGGGWDAAPAGATAPAP